MNFISKVNFIEYRLEGGEMNKSLIQFIKIIPLTLVFCFTLGCLQSLNWGLLKKQKLIEDRVLGIWNEGNLALISDVYAPNAVVRTSDFPQDIEGYEGIKNWVTRTRTTFPDFHMTIKEIVVKGNKVVTRWTSTGTNSGPLIMPFGNLPPTGKKVHFSGIAISRVENRKAVEELVVFNVLEMLQQLGFTLVPPSAQRK